MVFPLKRSASNYNNNFKKYFGGGVVMYDYFSGTIVQCRTVKNKTTNFCQGFGFVLYTKKEEALSAMKVSWEACFYVVLAVLNFFTAFACNSIARN